MWRPSYPPTPLPKKCIRCYHFGQNFDIYIYMYIVYSTILHQNTLTRKLMYCNGNKLVHRSIGHNLLPKDYHKESLSPPAAAYHFLLLPNQSIWNKYTQGQPNEPKHNPNHITQFNFEPNNITTLTCHDN